MRAAPRRDLAGRLHRAYYNQFAMTDDELKRLLEMNSMEIRRHFDVSTEEVKREIQILAEGISRVDEKLDRTAADIREEMLRSFGATRALLPLHQLHPAVFRPPFFGPIVGNRDSLA